MTRSTDDAPGSAPSGGAPASLPTLVQTIARNLPEPFFATDATGRWAFTNDAWSALTGLTDARAEGWLEAFVDEDTERARTAWTAVLDGSTPVQADLRLRAPDGIRRQWTRALFAPLHDADGQITGYFGRLADVSDLYREHAPVGDRARLLEMSDALMDVGHWHVFTDTGRLYWSEQVHRIHGTDPETFTPKLEDGLNAYHPDDRARIAQIVEEAVALGKPYTFEARLIRTDGAVRTVRSAGQPIARPGGGRDIIGVFQDITESRRLTERLRESEERYALAVAASQDGLWDWRCAANELWWSDRFLEIAGITRDDFDGTLDAFVSRVHPEDRDRTMAAVRAQLNERAPYDVLYRFRHASGRYVWLRAKGQARWDDEGRPTRMVGTVSDVTPQIEAETALAAKNEVLERTNRELDRFASLASHDMKEPLRKIRSFIERIVDRGSVQDAKSLDYLRRVSRAADRMYQMVNDVLEISRVPNLNAQRSCLDTPATVRAAVEGLAPVIDDLGATVDIDPLPGIMANPTQVEQVFRNLIDNALKYRSADRAPKVRIRALAPSSTDHVAIEVADNGIGFEPAYRDRIFGLFERLHGRSEYPGTGLGLALCKRIIEEHGGRISAVGTPGQGARFVMQWPACREGKKARDA